MQVMAGALGPLTRGSAAAQSYRDLIMGTSGLVAYYRLGEASGIVATDETGNYNGSYLPNSGGAWTGGTLGATGAIAGDADKAITSTGGYASIPDNPSIRAQAGFTAECWFKVGTSTSPVFFNKPATNDFRLDISGANIRLVIYPNAIISTPFTPSGWVHLAATISTGKIATLYINGVSVKTGTIAQSLGSTAALQIGNSASGSLSTDEAVIYDTALTSAQILAHYNKGAGI